MSRRLLKLGALFLVASMHMHARAEYVVDISNPAPVPASEQKLWFAYSVMLGMCIADNRHTYASFPAECDIAGREKMLEMLARGGQRPPSSYFKQLQAVQQAGYLREYVWRFQKKPHWNEPKGMKLPQFDAWAKEKLRGHVPQEHLQAKISLE